MCSTYQVFISLCCDKALVFDPDAAPSRYINPRFYRHNVPLLENIFAVASNKWKLMYEQADSMADPSVIVVQILCVLDRFQ